MIKNNIVMKLLFICYFFLPISSNSSTHIILEGLNAGLECNILKQLEYIKNLSFLNIDINCQNQINDIIRSTLRSVGYYEPNINISFSIINEQKDKNAHCIVIKVFAGKPVKVVEVNINILGDGKNDCDYQKIIKDSQFFIGKPLHHNDYQQLKSKLYNLSIAKGYLDAGFQKSQLIVIPSLYKCIWNIHFHSGNRYCIEKVKFIGSQIQEDYLNNISNMQIGEFYDIKSVIELNRRLSVTNWFESVSISLDPVKSFQKKNLYCMFY